MKYDCRMLHHDDIVFRTLFMPWGVSSRYRLSSRRKTSVFRQAAFGQKRTVAVRQARSSEPVGQLVPAGRRETPVLAKAQAGRGDVVFIFANQGGFAPAFKCCLSQKSLVLQNVLIDHIGAMAR